MDPGPNGVTSNPGRYLYGGTRPYGDPQNPFQTLLVSHPVIFMPFVASNVHFGFQFG